MLRRGLNGDSATNAGTRHGLSIHRPANAIARPNAIILAASSLKFNVARPRFENTNYAAYPNERSAGPNAARRRISIVMGSFWTSALDWLELSRVPPLISALVILTFAVHQIWRDWK
jgi:hypothetical protein